MMDDLNRVDLTPETIGDRDDVAKIRDFLQAKRERERQDRLKRLSALQRRLYRTNDPEAA